MTTFITFVLLSVICICPGWTWHAKDAHRPDVLYPHRRRPGHQVTSHRKSTKNADNDLILHPTELYFKDEIKVNIDNDDIKLDLKLTNFGITGISDFTIDKKSFSLLRLSVTIDATIPKINVASDYSIDALLADIVPLYGDGSLSVSLSNTKAHAFVQISVNGDDFVYLKDASLDVIVNKTTFLTDGFLGGGDLEDTLDEFLDMLGPNLLNVILVKAESKILPKLITYVNDNILCNKTIGDLVDIIKNLTSADLLQRQGDDVISEARAESSLNEEGNADAFLDAILSNARDVIVDEGLDPMDLPDEDETFCTEGPLGIDWTAGVTLTEGTLGGLATLHRTGEATIAIDGTDLTVNVDVGTNMMNIQYSLDAQVMGIHDHMSLLATIDTIDIVLEGRVSSVDLHTEITRLEMTNIGEISVDLDGLAVLDWVLEPFLEYFANKMKDDVGDLVANDLKDALNKQLAKIKLPDTTG